MEVKFRNTIYMLALVCVFVISFFLIKLNSDVQSSYSPYRSIIESLVDDEASAETIATHVEKPKFVKAIYLTAYSAGSDKYRANIIAAMKNSRINSVVIDIKDYSGHILYNSNLKNLKEIDTIRHHMPDVRKVLDDFHQAGIYVIARQTVFQDPALARAKPELAFKTKNGNTWYDNKGLAWIDPAKKEVWKYNLDIAKEATKLGFDEINFDYMRYPSDGNMGNLAYNIPEGKTKVQVLGEFFAYLSDNLSDLTVISIDTFGLVLDNTVSGYDLNIGQLLTDIANYFDYVCPMMYPSHYPLNYLGFSNSAEHPGAVIAYGLDISNEAMQGKRAQLRPWLQAFNLRAIYTEDLINQQTTATENATSTEGWLLWNARNYYPDHIF